MYNVTRKEIFPCGLFCTRKCLKHSLVEVIEIFVGHTTIANYNAIIIAIGPMMYLIYSAITCTTSASPPSMEYHR